MILVKSCLFLEKREKNVDLLEFRVRTYVTYARTNCKAVLRDARFRPSSAPSEPQWAQDLRASPSDSHFFASQRSKGLRPICLFGRCSSDRLDQGSYRLRRTPDRTSTWRGAKQQSLGPRQQAASFSGFAYWGCAPDPPYRLRR